MFKFEKFRRVKNFFVIFVVFSLVTGWFYSGWPRIWQKPAIPPGIQEAKAVTDKVEYIVDTASTTWTVPTDWTASNTIEVIGGGGGGRTGTNGCTGSGGGAYAKVSNISTLTFGSTVYLQVGSGGAAEVSGGDTWFNDTTATTTTCGDQSVCAKAGDIGANDTTAGLGGASSTSIGDPKFAGGNGGGSTTADPCGGGGGAGGPHGEGALGGAGYTSATNGAGGGGGGGGGGTPGQTGTASTPFGGAGGNNWQGSGGAATSSAAGNVGTLGGGGGGGADAYAGGVGGDGTDWSSSPAYGSGGGGGGAGDPDATGDNGGNGGLYGAGGGGGSVGGSGANGIIIIIYTPNNAPSFTDNTTESSDPVTQGDPVTFTATSTDSESDGWWLAVCKTNNATSGPSGAAPTCESEANTYCTSTSAVASGSQNTCDWTSSGSGAQNWWSFACDNNTITSKCSSANTANSPINVSVTISISLDTPTYDYGARAINSTASSTVITATNNGSGNENFDIIGSDAATTSPYMWELSTSTTGTDIYMHAYTTDSTEPSGTATGTDPAVGWVPLDKDGVYNTLATGVAKNGTVEFYLDMRTPAIAGASTTYGTPYETTVTVRASAP